MLLKHDNKNDYRSNWALSIDFWLEKKETGVCHDGIKVISDEAEKGAPTYLHLFPEWDNPFT